MKLMLVPALVVVGLAVVLGFVGYLRLNERLERMERRISGLQREIIELRAGGPVFGWRGLPSGGFEALTPEESAEIPAFAGEETRAFPNP